MLKRAMKLPHKRIAAMRRSSIQAEALLIMLRAMLASRNRLTIM